VFRWSELCNIVANQILKQSLGGHKVAIKRERDVVVAYGKVEKLGDHRVKWLARVVYSNSFELFIAAVISINAAALAVLTFPNIAANTRYAALVVDTICFTIYVIELLMRVASYGRKPWLFFTKGWNIFDFLVVAATPIFAGQTVVLRLLRLFRLVRIFRFLPEVRILSSSIVKSLPPLLSISALISLLLFLYGMVGFYLFGEALPAAWGTIGASMMSLIILLTLENFPVYLEDAMDVTVVAIPYMLSYVFIIVFTVLNLLIGIVLNAMDEARAEAKTADRNKLELDTLTGQIDQISLDGVISDEELEKLKREVERIRSLNRDS
jgi:voltage-gated sodium channel